MRFRHSLKLFQRDSTEIQPNDFSPQTIKNRSKHFFWLSFFFCWLVFPQFSQAMLTTRKIPKNQFFICKARSEFFWMLLLNATEVFRVSLYFMEKNGKMAKLAKMEKHSFNIFFLFGENLLCFLASNCFIEWKYFPSSLEILFLNVAHWLLREVIFFWREME